MWFEFIQDIWRTVSDLSVRFFGLDLVQVFVAAMAAFLILTILLSLTRGYS